MTWGSLFEFSVCAEGDPRKGLKQPVRLLIRVGADFRCNQTLTRLTFMLAEHCVGHALGQTPGVGRGSPRKAGE